MLCEFCSQVPGKSSVSCSLPFTPGVNTHTHNKCCIGKRVCLFCAQHACATPIYKQGSTGIDLSRSSHAKPSMNIHILPAPIFSVMDRISLVSVAHTSVCNLKWHIFRYRASNFTAESGTRWLQLDDPTASNNLPTPHQLPTSNHQCLAWRSPPGTPIKHGDDSECLNHCTILYLKD